MSFGSVQVTKAMGGMSPGPLGGLGPMGRHAPQEYSSPDVQLQGKRLDEDAIGIEGFQFIPVGYAGITLGQGISGWYPGPGEGPHHHSIFRRRVDADTVGAGTDARISPYQARLTGPVQFFKNLLDTWDLDSKAATVLLGMDPDDESIAGDLLAGRAVLRGRDVKDRIAYLYRIRNILSALFRDENVENQWLREPHTMLEERSPLDLMLDGSLENLLLVKEYVEAAAGR